ncbi:LLM class flavin-dependent oxidoreductase [Gordonia sp. zg691]|uniref:LLM class flavin-dependent oxidoreductase n=1 Tax=Gordonia jinghuaiqii TaxID=2758710 RepID=UPI0016625F6C|nr:LLM class flavin-dependent oxidoreductase [Gordonia jinghuaiqii]MBD0863448.1 LLM class flavin-dependent oxidoreductase [Gordonia jinghuaiqii]
MKTELEFGLMLAGQFNPGVDPLTKLTEAIEQTRAARSGGFDSLWTVQHFLADLQYFQPIPLLARLAAEAGDMHLGTSVLLVPHYPPVILAEELATLAVITGDRLIVGAGAGYRKLEFDAIGVPMRERYGRLEESIEVLRKLWSGDQVDHRGTYYDVSGVQLRMVPPRLGRQPVWLGATGPKGIARAARIGDEWLATNEMTVEDLRVGQDRYMEALPDGDSAEQRSFPVIREVLIAPSTEEALALAEPALRHKYANYAQWGHQTRPVEDLLDSAVVVGSPEHCVERLATLIEETRCRHLILRMQWPGSSHAAAMQSIELFSTRVAPELRSLARP